MPEKTALHTLGQISMRATDLPRAVTFYREVLGTPFLFEVPNMAFFDLDGVRLMLAIPEGTEDHPGSILYFKVEDIAVAHGDLAARGVDFDGPPMLVADMPDHELWMASFKDSEGNQLALMSEVAKD